MRWLNGAAIRDADLARTPLAVLEAGRTQLDVAAKAGRLHPGYYKNRPGNWEESSARTLVGSVFNFSGASPALSAYADTTFAQALRLRGGTGLDGATQILLRAAVAATLNAAHEGVGYPLRRAGADGIFAMVIEALASSDRQAMLNLAAYLDRRNNLSCPL